jgi:hypothetical protein
MSPGGAVMAMDAHAGIGIGLKKPRVLKPKPSRSEGQSSALQGVSGGAPLLCVIGRPAKPHDFQQLPARSFGHAAIRKETDHECDR